MPPPITILVADDSSDDRFLLARALAKTGLPTKLFEAEDGGEAIEFLSHTGRFSDPQTSPRPDLILLDLKMPGLNGFDVLRWLQQHPGEKTIQVVILSGSELETDRRQAREFGVAAYFTKPPTPDQLRDLIRSRLGIPAG